MNAQYGTRAAWWHGAGGWDQHAHAIVPHIDRQEGAFLAEWSLWSDRLLASGFMNPPRFARAIDALEVDHTCVPGPHREYIFEFLLAVGRNGIGPDVGGELIAAMVDALDDGPCPVPRFQAERSAYSYGTDVNVDRFVGWVREFRARARVYHRLPSMILDRDRSIRDICREVVEEVSGAVQRRSATSAA